MGPRRALDDAVRDDLNRAVTDVDLNAGFVDRLRRGMQKAANPKRVTETAIKRLDEQLGRAKWLHERGEYTTEEFMARRAAINVEKQALRQSAAAHAGESDLKWCAKQILDLVQVWDLADAPQRARLVNL